MKQVAIRFLPILRWAYGKPKVFPLVVDLSSWVFGLAIGVVIKLVFSAASIGSDVALLALGAMAIHLAVGWFFGLYRLRWRVASFDEVVALYSCWAVTSGLLLVGNFSLRPSISSVPTSAALTGSMVAFFLMTSSRGVWRRLWELNRRPNPDDCHRTIVLGAGSAAEKIVPVMLRDPSSTYYPVALLDDDPKKRNREIAGIQVAGTLEDLADVVAETEADSILVAVPTAKASLIQDISRRARSLGLDVRIVPPASELVGRMRLSDVRPITVEDLLGREPVEIDLEAVSGYVRGKRVLVTGAGGSIGSELSRQLFGFDPSHLYLLDRDETGLHSVQLSIEGKALLDSEMLIVADIRDRDRVFELFERLQPEVVFHAAALKHLTLLENHPAEGVKTNTVGTANLLDAAQKYDVETFVNVSTDKAADPTSVLGATKLAAERLTATAAAVTGRTYVSVRFGNVLGSRGSVLPTFLNQIENDKPITITHPDVTRYFMTIPEAVRLVIQAGAIGTPGDVMVLDMGEPVRIIDLAEQLINTLSPATRIEFTGLRPGEKLHEVLMADHEIGVVRAHPRITHTDVQSLDPIEALEKAGGGIPELARDLLGLPEGLAGGGAFVTTGTNGDAGVPLAGSAED